MKIRHLILFSLCIIFNPCYAFSKTMIISSIPVISSIASYISKQEVKSIVKERETGCVEHYSMKPSDAFLIKDADLIIAIGENFEPFFNNISKIKKDNASIIEISKIPGIKILNKKEKIDNQENNHNHSSEYDFHLWLNPANAKKIATEIAKQLAIKNPDKKDFYSKNLNDFNKEIDRIVFDIKSIISSHIRINYLLSHDNLQYFEDFFNIKSSGVISFLDSGEISIRQLLYIKKVIDDNKISLILVDGDNYPKGLKTVVDGTKIRLRKIDVTGASYKFSEDLYIRIIKDIVNNIYL
ncbi:MAG: High-affinity zinc uptake system protein ZnuA precursor [Alphaproteobacteria bacterium ADurb.Bin438]|nr:MAG: High-affinity zinc uptake system protein ZnuA precursor [Alphaproteobacteria bacterium ADurb.Bin438]